jgi:hypothetical protein
MRTCLPSAARPREVSERHAVIQRGGRVLEARFRLCKFAPARYRFSIAAIPDAPRIAESRSHRRLVDLDQLHHADGLVIEDMEDMAMQDDNACEVLEA